MLSSLFKLSEDAAGLEKILRFSQYGSQTAAALSTDSPETRSAWMKAQSQFTLTRRYFRLLKWYGCWSVAYQCFNDDRRPVEKMLRVAKWSFLGIYLFLEMFTITNAMGITSFDWAPVIFREGLKFWLYSIVASILLSVYLILMGEEEQPVKRDAEKEKDEEDKSLSTPHKTTKSASSKVYGQLAIDCADFFIPAGFLDWYRVDDLYIGLAGTLSSVLAGQEIMDRVLA